MNSSQYSLSVRYWHNNAATNVIKRIKYDSIQSLSGHF